MNNIPLKKLRALSNEDLMREGLDYKFKLKDLPKYSQTLHPNDLTERFT